MKTNIPCLILLSCLVSQISFAQEREIAITIDDLPFVGTNSNDAGNLRRTRERFIKILDTLIENQVPATGHTMEARGIVQVFNETTSPVTHSVAAVRRHSQQSQQPKRLG